MRVAFVGTIQRVSMNLNKYSKKELLLSYLALEIHERALVIKNVKIIPFLECKTKF